MKIRVHGKNNEIAIKERYAKHQTKNIQFVMTRNVLVFQGKMVSTGSEWVIRDYRTGVIFSTGKTIKKTEDVFFMLVKHKSFDSFYTQMTKNKPVLNEEETLWQ